MTTGSLLGIVILVFIAILAVWVLVESRKVKWYKVFMANNDIRLLKRDFRERFWRTSDRYMRFKDEFGKEVTFPSGAHWVLMWEEVDKANLEYVREEIHRMKQEIADERAAS